jgi:hypothetical protein
MSDWWWKKWQRKGFSSELWNSPANHHSAPYSPTTVPWSVRQPWPGSILSHAYEDGTDRAFRNVGQ